MFVLVTQALGRRGAREERWYGTPSRGTVTVGAALEGDIQILGHNLSSRHVVLHFGKKGRIELEVRSAYGVRLDGQTPRRNAQLSVGSHLDVGPWRLSLVPAPRSGIEPVDEGFLEAIERAPDDPDSRLVYADSLEERGRVAEADLVRGATAEDVASLAVRAPPAWRRRFLPMAIEGCTPPEDVACPALWSALPREREADARPCEACGRRVELFAHLGAAREHARAGRPLVLDPAVRRWADDLREPVVKRPAIDMGQPVRRA